VLKSQIQSEAVPHLALSLSGSLAGQKSHGALLLEEHFIKLFDELRIPVFRYLRTIGLRQEDGEEVVQEVFLRLFKHLLEEGGEENLRGWVYRVAHNLAYARYQDRSRLRQGSLEDEDYVWGSDLLQDQAPNPEQFLLGKERMARIDQAMRALPKRQLQCIYLRMEGFRYREIGEILGVSMGTVAECLHRAIKSCEAKR
jgi:RNA polymerase sigma-70 factor (ECF subfamily)